MILGNSFLKLGSLFLTLFIIPNSRKLRLIKKHDCSESINKSLHESFIYFDKKIKGFNNYDAVLSGIEARTSSPIRIIRNDNLMSNIKGIYPCGEGAGYAGGITSASIDGIKVSEAIGNYFKK